MLRKRKKADYERYETNRSPFAQNPTQQEVAALLGETRDDLRRLVSYREQFIIRRDIEANGKTRKLAYPVGRLRAAHERMKFHLNKIMQPSYLFSPRKGRGQRDNAMLHLNQDQYLTMDLKQFYPSTTVAMVRNWLKLELGVYDDVAGLLAKLSCVDGKVSFGSPLTPVLCTMVHRKMFDEIASICATGSLRYSVWVDDLTISGATLPGRVVDEIREVIRKYGLKSHKIHYHMGNGVVYITGIGVVGSNLVAPNSQNLKLRDLWTEYYTGDEKDLFGLTQALLSKLGTVRHISGPSSILGQKAANQMNSLRQKRDKLARKQSGASTGPIVFASDEEASKHDVAF